MNEILISIMIFVNGVVIGIFVGYLLGRYRIKIRRVVFQEDGQEVQETKLTLKQKFQEHTPGSVTEKPPAFLRKIMD